MAVWCVPFPLPSIRLRDTLPLPPHNFLPISREAGRRTQAGAGALQPGGLRSGWPGPLRCSARLGGPGCWPWGPRSLLLAPAPAPAPVRAGARRRPAPGTDQAACERRDSCSSLKYAGYFYLPTSGGEGHPTSGRGGCYTMFPFSREGKWREARLPDHMVLKSMKKN